ncbi:hypothetical protein [Fulvivirga ligni]|uniref:hypothetical protein n=1 Tax=Fulvivirga ligni TaxID=2904246 RepID=UPI001F26880A|nr:hypothetical protein [Fulvivirga ligni]UII21109.1 hypothetical protein LVD16_25050 [Fulvivirga ligni]
MRVIILLLLISSAGRVLPQSKIEKSFNAGSASAIHLKFTYPELIKVSSWDKNEVLIKGTVTINGNQNNDAFQLTGKMDNGELFIHSEIVGYDKLPKTITVKKDGVTHYFNTDNMNDPEVQKIMKDGQHSYATHGVNTKIQLEVMVPKGKSLNVVSKFGTVEIKGIHAPVEVTSKFGGVDLAVDGATTSDLTAKTQFGQIYSNLDNNFEKVGQEGDGPGKWTEIVSHSKGRYRVILESKFGDVYLRKID